MTSTWSRRLAGIAVLVLLAAPVASAEHYSAGATDTIATGLEETPDSRSVEGSEPGVDGTPYGAGTKPAEACYDPQPQITAQEALEAASSDGFCGQLVYDEELGPARTSPHDQHLPAPDLVSAFDVQHVWQVGGTLQTCVPFCGDADVFDGPQTYGVEIDVRNPADVAQEETHAWRMNGWSAPAAFETFVGYLQDGQGAPITEAQLGDMVTGASAGSLLDESAKPDVCGWGSPVSFAANTDACEVSLTYVDEEEAPTGSPDGSQDRCASPAYVCGAFGGGYWRGQTAGLLGAYGSGGGAEHVIWHWVIAPTAPEDVRMDPTFAFDVDDADLPYLAHDLDVYTPITGLADGPTVSPENTLDYVETLTPMPGTPS